MHCKLKAIEKKNMQINLLVVDIHKGELGRSLSYSPLQHSSYFRTKRTFDSSDDDDEQGQSSAAWTQVKFSDGTPWGIDRYVAIEKSLRDLYIVSFTWLVRWDRAVCSPPSRLNVANRMADADTGHPDTDTGRYPSCQSLVLFEWTKTKKNITARKCTFQEGHGKQLGKSQ